RLLALEYAHDLAAGDLPYLLHREAGLERAAQAQDGRDRRGAVRHVAGEEDLPGRDEPEPRHVVGDAPPRAVEEQARMVGSVPPDPGEIADTVVGEYQPEVRVARRDVEGVPSQRRDSPPGVRDHRQPALVRQGEDPLEALVVEPELLRARVEL